MISHPVPPLDLPEAGSPTDRPGHSRDPTAAQITGRRRPEGDHFADTTLVGPGRPDSPGRDSMPDHSRAAASRISLFPLEISPPRLR